MKAPSKSVSKSPGTLDVFGDTRKATRALARRDVNLRKCLKAIEKPVIRRRDGGFEGLFRIIVEQQVSVPSAQAIWKRCVEGLSAPSVKDVLKAGDTKLKSFGLSAPKARYVLGVAAAVRKGAFSFDALPMMNDEEATASLTSLKGIGPWSAAIYLLFCEGRADIWPSKDVALKAAYNAASGEGLSQQALDDGAYTWAPYRGISAHILWTYYAHLKGRTPI